MMRFAGGVHGTLSPTTIVTVVKALRGGAQSKLVLCDDNKLYVLKTQPNPQGPNLLANEAIGSILLQGLGLHSPSWRPVRTDLKALRFFPELATTSYPGSFQVPACGFHFGSEYLGGPDYELFDFLPGNRLNTVTNATQLLGIFLFDLWANHKDQRQCVFRRKYGVPGYEAYFIDNGHLFGGPSWRRESGQSQYRSYRAQFPILTLDEHEVDSWLQIFASRIPQLLRQAVATIPPDWYEGDIHSHLGYLVYRLESLRAVVRSQAPDAARVKTIE